MCYAEFLLLSLSFTVRDPSFFSFSLFFFAVLFVFELLRRLLLVPRGRGKTEEKTDSSRLRGLVMQGDEGDLRSSRRS